MNRPRMRTRIRATLAATIAVAATLAADELRAQDGAAPRLALERGLVFVQTLHTPDADRESWITVDSASAVAVRYVWSGLEVHANGDTMRFEHARVVSTADLAGSARLHDLFPAVWKEVHPHYFTSESKEPAEHPGYTIWSLSTAVYRQLRTEGSAPISILMAEAPVGAGAALAGLGFGGAREVPVRWKGTLTRVSAAPESFPLIVDGRRVAVPALHLRGQFTARERAWAPEIWVLADSAHPLLLKWIGAFQQEENVLQTVRVAHPVAAAALERGLRESCRAELPGVYFGFNSAALDPASEKTIASLADVLARHPDWQVTIEGHTDSIGAVAANQVLSERRVEAVRQRLTTAYRVDAGRLRIVGYGRSRPRESNATIEGRARNRRVELVRDCAGQNRSK